MPDSYDQIAIKGKTFRIKNRYAAGHQLTPGEATALNQTLHENIRNNFANRIKKAPDASLEELQAMLDNYTAEYQLGARQGPSAPRGPTSDPVATLAMNMAREMVRRAIDDKKLPKTDWPAARVSQAAKALLDSQGPAGKILIAARAQIETERAVASDNIAAINAMLEASSEPRAPSPS